MTDAGLPVAAPPRHRGDHPRAGVPAGHRVLRRRPRRSARPRSTTPIIDQGLAVVRRMWDVGLAHRDIKPANLLVRDGRLLLIDAAFAEVRPSPWRQAVDLANMMLVLALRTDAERVYAAGPAAVHRRGDRRGVRRHPRADDALPAAPHAAPAGPRPARRVPGAAALPAAAGPHPALDLAPGRADRRHARAARSLAARGPDRAARVSRCEPPPEPPLLPLSCWPAALLSRVRQRLDRDHRDARLCATGDDERRRTASSSWRSRCRRRPGCRASDAALPLGWSFHHLDARNGVARFWLDSDRDGDAGDRGPARAESCDTAGRHRDRRATATACGGCERVDRVTPTYAGDALLRVRRAAASPSSSGPGTATDARRGAGAGHPGGGRRSAGTTCARRCSEESDGRLSLDPPPEDG